MNLSNEDKRLYGVEDRILRIIITEIEKPYLWYKDDLGKEFLVIDYRYDHIFKAITNEGERIGYISKKCCKILEVIEPRKIPDFPFQVKVLKNSWFPQCWYANKIGEVFQVKRGGGIIPEWRDIVTGGEHEGNIRQEDCEILDVLKWFIEYEDQRWLEQSESGLTTNDPMKALQFESKALTNLYIVMNNLKNCRPTEHEFVFQSAVAFKN